MTSAASLAYVPPARPPAYGLRAIGITAVLYAVLGLVLSRMVVPTFLDAKGLKPPERKMQLFDLNPSRLPAFQPLPVLSPGGQVAKPDKLASLFNPATTPAAVAPAPAVATPAPPPTLVPVRQGLGRDILKPPAPPTVAAPAPPMPPPPPAVAPGPPPAPAIAPLPTLLASKFADLPPDRQALPGRTLIPDLPRVPLPAGLLPAIAARAPSAGSGGTGPGGTGGGAVDGGTEMVGLGMRLTLPRRGTPDLPDALQPTQDVPEARTPIVDATPGGDYGVLDSLMRADVRIYRDPRSGDGYYEVTIRANEANDRLKAIPHNVLYVLDASASMTQEKLVVFQDTLLQSLPALAPQDRFNVAVFRDKPRILFPEFMAPTPKYLKEATSFISSQYATGQTDVYAGIAPLITFDRAADAPPYLIILVSDGRTTTGQTLANNEFIRQLTRENRAHAALYTIGAGEGTNLFLMEFLSYSNRGVSLNVPELAETPARGREFLSQLTQMIVADPVVSVTGLLNQDLYPKQLPHLFRQAPLRLYGRFPRGTKELGLQILGRNHLGKREELVVRVDLDHAQAGTADLAKLWAGQKIYYLTSQWIKAPDPSKMNEIYRLADQYKILVPF